VSSLLMIPAVAEPSTSGIMEESLFPLPMMLYHALLILQQRLVYSVVSAENEGYPQSSCLMLIDFCRSYLLASAHFHVD
jgi:hypothetical protein